MRTYLEVRIVVYNGKYKVEKVSASGNEERFYNTIGEALAEASKMLHREQVKCETSY